MSQTSENSDSEFGLRRIAFVVVAAMLVSAVAIVALRQDLHHVSSSDSDDSLTICFSGLQKGGRTGVRVLHVVFRNNSEETCNIDAIHVVDDEGRQLETIANVSTWPLVDPGSYSHATIELADDVVETRLLVDFHPANSGNNLTLSHSVSSSDQSVALEAVHFSEELRDVYAYFSTRDEMLHENDLSVKANEQETDIVDTSSVKLSSGEYLHCVHACVDERLNEGKHTFIEVSAGNGVRLGLSARAHSLFAVALNQYEYPLRVVRITNQADGVVATLYNESDSTKPSIRIDRISVDGADVTANCLLPPGNLPPDMHRFTADERNVFVPLPQDRQGNFTVRFDYTLIPQSSATTEIHRHAGMLETIVERRLSHVIGGQHDAYVRGCISVHSGGLRPQISVEELRERVRGVVKKDQCQPVYATLVDGADSEEIEVTAKSCDFVVVGLPLSGRTSADPVERIRRYYEDVRTRCQHVPFIASVVKESSGTFTSGDVHWLTLMALAEGSKGVLLPATGRIRSDEFVPVSSLLTTSTSAMDSDALGRLLSHAQYASVEISGNQQGLHVGTLMCGSDRCIVVVLNKWCTMALPAGDSEYYAVPRREVILDCDLGSDWAASDATDLATGKAVKCRTLDGDVISVAVPDFETGRVILLERSRAPRSTSAGVGSIASLGEQTATSSSVVPVESPFIDLGRVEVGSSHDVSITVRNTSACDTTLRIRPDGLLATGTTVSGFSDIVIPAGGSREVSGILRVQGEQKRSLSKLVVTHDGDSADAFSVFIAADASCAFSVSPQFLDFGLGVISSDERLSKDFSIQSLLPDANVSDVRFHSTFPADVEALEGDKRFRLVPRIEQTGKFAGILTVDVVLDAERGTRSLKLPFAGTIASPISATPATLFLSGMNNDIANRSVRLSCNNGKRFRVSSLGSSGKSIAVSTASREWNMRHEVSLIIQPDRLSADDSDWVEMECEWESGELMTIRVPVRCLKWKPAVASRDTISAQQDGGLKTDIVLARADTLLRDIRGELVDLRLGTWLRAHALLAFGDSAYKSAETDAEVQKLVQSILDVRVETDTLLSPFVLRRGRPYPRQSGDRFNTEHHRDQVLHIISMAGVPLDATIVVKGQKFKVNDLLEQSLQEVRTTPELAWTVSAYSHYLQPGHKWNNKFNEPLSLDKLVVSLLDETKSACGGTHRMMAVARCLTEFGPQKDSSLIELRPILQKLVDDELDVLMQGQHEDGRFELPESFKQRFEAGELTSEHEIDVYFSGHALEWLATALPVDALQEQWCLRAVDYLVDAIEADFRFRLNTGLRGDKERYAYGNLCHALSALDRWTTRVRHNIH